MILGYLTSQSLTLQMMHRAWTIGLRLGLRQTNLSVVLFVDSKLADSEAHLRELRLIVRLGQPFGALLLAQQRGGEYKRVASDHLIMARVRDMTCVDDMMMDIRTLEIL